MKNGENCKSGVPRSVFAILQYITQYARIQRMTHKKKSHFLVALISNIFSYD